MRYVGLVLMVVLVAGCGVPRGVGDAAGRQVALLAAVPGDDDGVRAALVAQADAWQSLTVTVRRHEAFGVAVGTDFVALVDQTAALARRQRELIEQGKDDPAANRAVLEAMRKLWGDGGGIWAIEGIFNF